METFATGCVIEPVPSGVPHLDVFLGASSSELPDNFVVSAYRNAFDENFNPIPGKFKVKSQLAIPSCVGESTAYAKAADEGVEISGRDAYRLAKRKDGTNNVLSWGTSIAAALDAQIDSGVASVSTVPDNTDQSLEKYVSIDDVDADVVADRAKHKTKNYFFVNRNEILATVYRVDRPLVTSSQWYQSDNGMAGNTMRAPMGQSLGGHAFCVIGWRTRNGVKQAIVPNSFSDKWGDNGFFYIPFDGTEMRLGNGYVSVDVPSVLLDVLKKFDGKNVQVMGDPRIWRIEGGVKRHYSDEIVWWSFGNLFGYETYDISFSDLELIPVGKPMDIEQAPWHNRELIRQIRQFYGKM